MYSSAVVDALPVVVADGDDLEEPARLDLGPVIGKFAGTLLPRAGRQPLPDLVVDVLDLTEERVTALGKHVSRRPDGQVTAGPQRLPGSRVTQAGVDPVPRGSRVHQSVWLTRLPFLELALHHLHRPSGQVLAGGRGQFGAELDAGDPETPPRQRAGRLPRRAPHLEQAVARREAGQGDEIIEQGLGIVGSHPVVEPSGPVERLPQLLALILSRHRASMPSMIRDETDRHNLCEAPPEGDLCLPRTSRLATTCSLRS